MPDRSVSCAVSLASPAPSADPRLTGVPALILDRARGQDELPARGDTGARRLGLVVQGGAMRGVFSAGALCGLHLLGAHRVFDVVHGSSGGAVNAAYFLAGQVPLGTSIYYEDINNRTFIDFRRILTGTALALDYCFDEVVAQRKRLDLAAVLESRTSLHVHVTDAETSLVTSFRQHDLATPDELFTLLKASSAMPLVYRKPIRFRGKRYVDGAFFAALPLRAAITSGATDILVVLSRPLAEADTPPEAWTMPIALRSVRWNRSAAAHSWRQSEKELRESLALLRSAARGEPTHASGSSISIAVVSPSPSFQVTRWTKDRQALLSAAREGAEAMLALCGVPPAERRSLADRALMVEDSQLRS